MAINVGGKGIETAAQRLDFVAYGMWVLRKFTD
jgi:hypothetical protein